MANQIADPDPEAPAGGLNKKVPGLLALVGGAEWQEGCDFDAALLEASGNREIVVLPTAAAYERPERAVKTAEAYFARLGGVVRPLMVLAHLDATVAANAEVVRSASFVYLSGGSPLHLLSVLKSSAVLEALVAAWSAGAVIAGSSAGAMALADPMVDPRGGALTVGLGLVENLAIVPHHSLAPRQPAQHLWRTLELAPPEVVIAGIAERTALIRQPGGTWTREGRGEVTLYLGGEEVGIDALPAELPGFVQGAGGP